MPDSRDTDTLTVQPAGDPGAPPSSDYNVDLRPHGEHHDAAGGGLLIRAETDRLVVCYVAGPGSSNAGEAMVAAGPPAEVAGVLTDAGYEVDAWQTMGDKIAGMGRDELLERARRIDVSVREVKPWRFEFRISARSAAGIRGDKRFGRLTASTLAEGLLAAMSPKEAAAALNEGPLVDASRTIVTGPGRIRISVPNRGARRWLRRQAANNRCSLETIAASVMQASLAAGWPPE